MLHDGGGGSVANAKRNEDNHEKKHWSKIMCNYFSLFYQLSKLKQLPEHAQVLLERISTLDDTQHRVRGTPSTPYSHLSEWVVCASQQHLRTPAAIMKFKHDYVGEWRYDERARAFVHCRIDEERYNNLIAFHPFKGNKMFNWVIYAHVMLTIQDSPFL